MNDQKNKLLKALITFTLLMMTTSHALAGAEGRGGGDLCEDRIKIIRDDLKVWIHNGGHKSLKLPSGLTAESYASRMLKQLDIAKIKCVSKGDPGFPVEIDHVPKVCAFARTSVGSFIKCDAVKFEATPESKQYTLIHHEYAGLAQLELPNGADSTYLLSNQISGSLVSQWVQRLAVKTQVLIKANWEIQKGEDGERQAWALARALSMTTFRNCNIVVELNKTAPQAGTSGTWGGFAGNGTYSYDVYYGSGVANSTNDAGTDVAGSFLGNDSGWGSGYNTSPSYMASFTPRDLVNSKDGKHTTTLFKNRLGQPLYKTVWVQAKEDQVLDQEKGWHTMYFYIDASGSYIEKVGLQHTRIVNVNVGTIMEPKYVEKEVTEPLSFCQAYPPKSLK